MLDGVIAILIGDSSSPPVVEVASLTEAVPRKACGPEYFIPEE